ncbi:hypothetical protein DERP_007381 [Dermatophagoides pteronyssinus]|uniref:Transmembrane protein n=1 Tax=Dermatophagoides pteronyssinus TaxID=6956 RepID=A0ABQ8J468_DERPT|nr:hypothetical protein DERP_007381 [Dermatophagoides pteronyssinus]
MTISTQSPSFFVTQYSFDMDYFSICIPLYFTLSILICMSFSSKGGNLWWFGMRKDFCSFLLILCPCLREYANISYNLDGILSSSSPNSLEINNAAAANNANVNNVNEQQNERTNLTQSSNAMNNKKKNGKKFSKKSTITKQPTEFIIPNLLRLDIPD